MDFKRFSLAALLVMGPLAAEETKQEVTAPQESVVVVDESAAKTRATLESLTASNASVLKEFDTLSAHWQAYKLENSSFDLSRMFDAVTFAAQKHKGQVRKDAAKTPYITHPLGVTRSLWEEGQVRDEDTLIGALLHDTLEDTPTTAKEIEKKFGSKVRTIVEELTNDPTLTGEQNKRRQIAKAPSLSPEAKTIKLADRLYNLRDLRNPPPSWSEEQVQRYVQWGDKLREVLTGTNDDLESALQKEVQTLQEKK